MAKKSSKPLTLADYPEAVRRRILQQLIDSFTPEQRDMWDALRLPVPRGRVERAVTRFLMTLEWVQEGIDESREARARREVRKIRFNSQVIDGAGLGNSI